ncbi:hypothetical protein ACFX2I_015431 [Malus domestica]
MTSQTATSLPMEGESPTTSVLMLMNFIPRPFRAALYELKINQAGEVLGGETCRPLEPVHWFFDPKKSSEFPVPVPDYIILDGVRYGSPSKLYHLTDPASFPLITNPSFECYNPKDIWEPLNPFPKYGQKTGPSYVEVMG